MSGLLDNRTILEKADLSLADLTSGGLLQPAQAQKFLRLMIKQSKIMSMCAVTPMKAPKQLIEKIRFTGRVMHPGTENTALTSGNRSKPTLTKVELDAELFKAEVNINNEVLEDSIERGELRQTIMQLLAEKLSTDMEEVLINGDTGSADPDLAVLDGILVQATSNIVDAQLQTPNPSLFKSALKSMPSEFLRNKLALKFLTSIDAEIEYRDALSNRATVLGDKFLEQAAPVTYSGIEVIDVPLFPENLGSGLNTTDIVLADPSNINLGVWRNIRLETDKQVREGNLLVVATLRWDVKYIEETAVVKVINVKVA